MRMNVAVFDVVPPKVDVTLKPLDENCMESLPLLNVRVDGLSLK
jgi:hypothetical protein